MMSFIGNLTSLAADVGTEVLGNLAEKWNEEVHAAEVRIVRLVLWAGAAVLSGSFALALGVTLLVWVLPPGGRVIVLASAAGLALVVCVVIAVALRQTLARTPATHPQVAAAALLRRILRDLRKRSST